MFWLDRVNFGYTMQHKGTVREAAGGAVFYCFRAVLTAKQHRFDSLVEAFTATFAPLNSKVNKKDMRAGCIFKYWKWAQNCNCGRQNRSQLGVARNICCLTITYCCCCYVLGVDEGLLGLLCFCSGWGWGSYCLVQVFGAAIGLILWLWINLVFVRQFWPIWEFCSWDWTASLKWLAQRFFMNGVNEGSSAE